MSIEKKIEIYKNRFMETKGFPENWRDMEVELTFKGRLEYSPDDDTWYLVNKEDKIEILPSHWGLLKV